MSESIHVPGQGKGVSENLNRMIGFVKLLRRQGGEDVVESDFVQRLQELRTHIMIPLYTAGGQDGSDRVYIQLLGEYHELLARLVTEVEGVSDELKWVSNELDALRGK